MLNKKAFKVPLVMCVFILLTALTSTGCAVLDLTNPKAPEISINAVRPQSIGGTLQRLEIELLVKNPNRFALQVQGLDFTAFVNGEKLAKGDSDKAVTVPAVGEALLDVQVVLGLAELLSQARKLFTQSKQGPLHYGVSGTVDLENWPSPIPFDVEGEYSNPLQ